VRGLNPNTNPLLQTEAPTQFADSQTLQYISNDMVTKNVRTLTSEHKNSATAAEARRERHGTQRKQ